MSFCFALLSAAWAILLYSTGRPLGVFIFGVLTVVFLALIAVDLSTLTITPTAVEIASLARTRRIAFGDISSIEFVDIPYRGNIRAAVVLTVRSGRPVRLFRFREGSPALHEALRTAWQRAKR